MAETDLDWGTTIYPVIIGFGALAGVGGVLGGFWLYAEGSVPKDALCVHPDTQYADQVMAFAATGDDNYDAFMEDLEAQIEKIIEDATIARAESFGYSLPTYGDATLEDEKEDSYKLALDELENIHDKLAQSPTDTIYYNGTMRQVQKYPTLKAPHLLDDPDKASQTWTQADDGLRLCLTFKEFSRPGFTMFNLEPLRAGYINGQKVVDRIEDKLGTMVDQKMEKMGAQPASQPGKAAPVAGS